MFCVFAGATGLKDLKITVPTIARSGDAVWLTCNYDLEGKLLYTVKWYLNDEEFYRYAPKRNPPGLALPVKNIKVNVSKYYIFTLNYCLRLFFPNYPQNLSNEKVSHSVGRNCLSHKKLIENFYRTSILLLSRKCRLDEKAA